MNLLKKCSLLMVLMAAVMTVSAAACGGCVQPRLICVGEKPVGADEEIALLDVPSESAAELVEYAVERWMEDENADVGDEDIDLRAYGFSIDECMDVVAHLQNEHPEWFSIQLSCLYYEDSDDAFGIRVSYAMSRDEHDQAEDVYLSELESIVDLVDFEWSPLQKVLFVHDYLAANYEYDVEGLAEENATQTLVAIRDAYRFFSEKKGVCQAYTIAFTAVMQKLGIDASYVESEQINHIWNLVKLENEWYHLDVTHDDPTYDRIGYVSHSNFLLSDDAMKKEKGIAGEDWEYGVSGTIGDSYDDYFWQDAVSPFVEVDGVWYYVDEEGLNSWNGSDVDSISVVGAFGGVQIGNSIWGEVGGFAGLAVYADKLYYNSLMCIKSYDLKTGEIEILKTVEGNPNQYQFEGLRVDDGILNYAYLKPVQGSDIYTLDIRPFIPMDHVYAYHAEDGKVEIKLENLPKDGKVLIVCYDGNGAFTGIQFCSESKVYDLPAGRISLLAMDFESGKPLCKKADL